MKKTKLEVLGEFVGHLFLGAAMFVVVFLTGGALSIFVHWVAPFFDSGFISLMMLLENVILYSDAIFFIWWTVYSTYRVIKEL